MPDPTATRLPRIIRLDKKPSTKPEWAHVIDTFYADSFDARTKDALLESAEAFAEMAPEEQAFHQAHLAFRQVQALADIHATLKGIERGLAALDPKALAALRHLPGVRKALVVIARGQQEVLAVLEAGADAGVRAQDRDDDDDHDDENPDARDDDDSDGDGDDERDDDDDDSELEDAVDAVEEEDHGNGDVASVVLEVLPAGARRPAADDGGAS